MYLEATLNVTLHTEEEEEMEEEEVVVVMVAHIDVDTYLPRSRLLDVIEETSSTSSTQLLDSGTISKQIYLCISAISVGTLTYG